MNFSIGRFKRSGLFFAIDSIPLHIHMRYILGQKMSNKLSMCQLTTGKWREVQVTYSDEEDMPRKGYGQSMIIHQGYLYVYTGIDSFDCF